MRNLYMGKALPSIKRHRWNWQGWLVGLVLLIVSILETP